MSSTVLVESFLRLINLYVYSESNPANYGTDTMLTRSEIHTIEAIGNHPSVNVTELAVILGKSKSAVSQMLTRLKAKNVVIQIKLTETGRDTSINLTEQGLTAYRAHAAGHSHLYSSLDDILNSLDDVTKMNAT